MERVSNEEVQMKGSMADYLKVVTPHLHPELVSPEAMYYLQGLAQVLPPFSQAMLEFRLGVGQPEVDLSVFFHRRTLQLPDKFLTHFVWQSLEQFCREWVEPTSLLYRRVRYIGLEFDLHELPCKVPIPCVFLAWNQETVINNQSLIEIALRLLNYSVSSKLESNLRLCVESLPKGAKVEHLGAMLSRPCQPLRVIMSDIPLKRVADYLIQIGWVDPTSKFFDLLSSLENFGDILRLLSFDIGNTIHPRIGLEFFPKKSSLDESQWQLFLNYLIEIGLCSPGKKNALLTWPGLSQKADHLELWPKELTGGELLLGSRAFSIFWRTINHIKIVYQPGSPLEAKGYVMFGHQWVYANPLTTGC
ncbi:hypothetical protein [Allocoleopsis sp.]|uniref:hypothetical protein n=1 Tax=Allocoleopsis sp. TaxID=3088169 RepID=UPI002FD5B1D0